MARDAPPMWSDFTELRAKNTWKSVEHRIHGKHSLLSLDLTKRKNKHLQEVVDFILLYILSYHHIITHRFFP